MAQVEAMIEKIGAGTLDSTFGKLYGSGAVQVQRNRYIQALEEFGKLFGRSREVSLYSAPGRTEIGGNHTDHNNGIVMAAAVDLDIIAVVSKNADNTVRVQSQGFDRMDEIDLSVLTPVAEEQGRSSALIRGIAAGICEAGGVVGGFDAFTTSNVLRGSGLSSSAAFEVVIGEIFNGEFNDGRFSAVKNAQIGQYAENRFFGKPCGLLDQTACAVGGAITIDFEKPEQPIVDKVAFDISKYGYHLCITDTKGSHADLTDDYAAIRSEMESVAEYFGKRVLREITEKQLMDQIVQVREAAGDRAVLRALHFFAECARTRRLYQAVSEERFGDFLQMVIEGGHSSFEYNQNAYSIKDPRHQGVSVGLALSQKMLSGRGAWRLQGGGFAGTIQAFVPQELLEDYCSVMERVFGQGACYVLSVRNHGAVQVVENL